MEGNATSEDPHPTTESHPEGPSGTSTRHPPTPRTTTKYGSPMLCPDFKALSDKGGNHTDAKDRVIIVGAGASYSALTLEDTSVYSVLCRLTDFKSRLTITQLSIMLGVVHTKSDRYTVLKYQCYWYSRVLYLMIREVTGADSTNEMKAQRRGKVCRIPTFQTPDEDVPDLMVRYRAAVEEFDRKAKVSLKITRQ